VISGSLPSYSWTCDNVIQCLDGSDEAGCGSCTSDRLLLKGIAHDDVHSWLNGVYTKESYLIYNKAVWHSAIGTSYIYHNGTAWVMGSSVGEKHPLLYSDSAWATLFGAVSTWRIVSSNVAVPALDIVCVTSSVRHCFGSLNLVSINDRNMDLKLESERSENRATYRAADNTTLRYVMTSDNWDTPHWQVAQTVNSSIEELIVFLDTTLHPGYITTPGIELYNEQWVRGSNVYLKCSDQVEEGTRMDVDCVFSKGVCGWDVYRGSKFLMSNGPAEHSSRAGRVASSLYVVADKDKQPGKYRLTSPYIDVVTDSCVVLTIALSGSLLGSDNVTLTRLPLYDADQVMWSSDQITHDLSGELNYTTVYSDLLTGDSTKLKFEVVLGKNEQISGVVSLTEIAVFEKACQEVDFFYEDDPCYDWPCGSGECIKTGLKSFICSCPTTTIGDRCETDLSCPNVNISNAASTQIINNILLVTCQEGFQLTGDLPVCGEYGWSELPTCQVKLCNMFKVENGEVTFVESSGNNSVVESASVSCDTGHGLVGRVGLDCVLGEWDSFVPRCLKSCAKPSSGISLNPMIILIRKCSETYEDNGANAHQMCSIKNVTTNQYGLADSSFTHDDMTSLIRISVSSTAGKSDADTLCVDRHDGTQCVRTCSYMSELRIWLAEAQFLEFSTHFVTQERVNGARGFSLNLVLLSSLLLVFLEAF